MRLSFDSIDEVKEFVKGLKTTRTGKGGDDAGDGAAGAQAGNVPPLLNPPAGNVPPLLNPPVTGQAGGPVFAPQGAGAGTLAAPVAAAAFPGGQVAQLDPAIVALVGRVVERIKIVLVGEPAKNIPPQDPGALLTWFQNQCKTVDPSAGAATLDQIAQVYLYKLNTMQLTEIARLMSA